MLSNVCIIFLALGWIFYSIKQRATINKLKSNLHDISNLSQASMRMGADILKRSSNGEDLILFYSNLVERTLDQKRYGNDLLKLEAIMTLAIKKIIDKYKDLSPVETSNGQLPLKF